MRAWWKRHWLVVEVLDRKPMFLGRSYQDGSQGDPIVSRHWLRRRAITTAKGRSERDGATYSAVRIFP